MHRLNISYKQFYVTLNEIWLFESDPNAPSTWSEPGGKQWQRSIRGRRNWDVELGPCAVIRHLCSVAFVWEMKRPQADNSRSLIDRQVSCFSVYKGFWCNYVCHSFLPSCLTYLSYFFGVVCPNIGEPWMIWVVIDIYDLFIYIHTMRYRFLKVSILQITHKRRPIAHP